MVTYAGAKGTNTAGDAWSVAGSSKASKKGSKDGKGGKGGMLKGFLIFKAIDYVREKLAWSKTSQSTTEPSHVPTTAMPLTDEEAELIRRFRGRSKRSIESDARADLMAALRGCASELSTASKKREIPLLAFDGVWTEVEVLSLISVIFLSTLATVITLHYRCTKAIGNQ